MNIKKIMSLGMCVVLGGICLTGCGAIKEDPNPVVEAYVQEVATSEDVKSLYSSLLFNEETTSDTSTMSEEELSSFNSIRDTAASNIASRTSVKIVDTSIDNKAKTATVTAEVTGVDMLSCLKLQQKSLNEYATELMKAVMEGTIDSQEFIAQMQEKLTAIVVDTIKDEQTEAFTQTVVFNLSYDKEAKNWKVTSTDVEVANVLVGNFEAATAYMDEMDTQAEESEVATPNDEAVTETPETAENVTSDIVA